MPPNPTKQNRDDEKDRNFEISDWKKAESKGVSILVRATQTHAQATNVLTRLTREANLPVHESPLVRVLLAGLEAEFAPRSARLRMVRNQNLEHLMIRVNQTLTNFLTYFEEAISKAETQGNQYDDARKKALIEEALDNGEPELAAFSSSLQLSIIPDWFQVRDMCVQFDHTTKGMARLRKPKIKGSISAIESGCPHCGKKYHAEKDCWLKHPEKRPKGKPNGKTFRPTSGYKRKAETPVKSKDPDRKFKFPRPEISMLSEELGLICSIEGEANRVYVDSCAQNRIWLFNKKHRGVNFKDARGAFGTVAKGGSIWFEGVGKVNKFVVHYVPKARRNLMSVGCLLLIKCGIGLHPDTNPTLTTRDGTVYYGEWDNMTPHWDINLVLRIVQNNGYDRDIHFNGERAVMMTDWRNEEVKRPQDCLKVIDLVDTDDEGEHGESSTAKPLIRDDSDSDDDSAPDLVTDSEPDEVKDDDNDIYDDEKKDLVDRYPINPDIPIIMEMTTHKVHTGQFDYYNNSSIGGSGLSIMAIDHHRS